MLGRQPFLETDRRRESEIRASQRRVGVRVPHVALLGGIAAEDRAASRNSTDHVEHLINRDTGTASNIVHAAGDSQGGGGDSGADRIRDERKVPRLLPVAVHA